MGVVLVGPSGSGKSTIWTVLKQALHILNQQALISYTNTYIKIKYYIVKIKIKNSELIIG